MSTQVPKYDTGLMFSRGVGAAGTPEADFAAITTELERVKEALLREWRIRPTGFFTLPDRKEELRAVEKLAAAISKKASTLIVIGIGGSDLGARALLSALADPRRGGKPAAGKMDIRFIGANADPEELAAFLTNTDLKKCALNVVSKSGDTIEPMAAFLVLRDRLIKRIGVKAAVARIVVTTDPQSGALREIAEREGYATLAVPKEIGGRFSALTAVGLFPAACAGIPAKRLLVGAAAVRQAFMSEPAAKNAALLFAGLHHDAYANRGKDVTVLMPYSAALHEFAFWFRQLWAESLGKAKTRSGKTVHDGFTPVAAAGPADQHSQLQLYNEGPTDKIVTFLTVDHPRADVAIPKAYKDISAAASLGGKTFAKLLHAEHEATARALASHGRPSGTLSIPAVTPESIGGLMMFFMLATAAAAEMFDVDAYNQPGVEEGKRLIRELF